VDLLAVQWQRTDTYSDTDATNSLNQLCSDIPHAEYVYVDVRISVSGGSTATPYTTLLSEYTTAVNKIQLAGKKPVVRCRTPSQTTLNPNNKPKFFSTYATACAYWASFCEAYGVEWFCIGTEFTQIEGSTYNTEWAAVVAAVRAVFSGNVFYETNYWYQATGATDSRAQKLAMTWLQNLDYIAVSAYWDIADTTTDSVANMVANWSDLYWWHQDVLDELQTLADTHSKQLVLVTGCASNDGAAMHPWDYTWDPVVVDTEEQRRWFESFFQVHVGAAYVAGYMIDGCWFTVSNKNPDNNEFTVQNKPASDTIETYYAAMTLLQPTKTFTFNSWLQKTVTEQFSLDGYLKLEQTKEFTVDAVLTDVYTKTFTVDGYLQAAAAAAFTLDAIPWTPPGLLFDALLKLTETAAFVVDGVLEAESVAAAFTYDSVLQGRKSEWTFDGFLKWYTATISGLGLMEQVIQIMEQENIGKYVFAAGCVEPGCDNVDVPLRRVIRELESAN